MTKRRWLAAVIDASKTTEVALPWTKAGKSRPASFKHIQIHVAPRPKAMAAR